MIATAITVVLCALLGLAAIGIALAPLLAFSGWRANVSAKLHLAEANDIERDLSAR
jgi:hypothetical protein